MSKKINENYGIGELPSSKLMKMSMKLSDIMKDSGDQHYTPVTPSKANHLPKQNVIPGKVYDNPYAAAFVPVENSEGIESGNSYTTDYDHEGEMARTQLEKCIDHSQMLRGMIDDESQLPAWVQAKLTKASDYLQAVCNYMDGKDGLADDGAFRIK